MRLKPQMGTLVLPPALNVSSAAAIPFKNIGRRVGLLRAGQFSLRPSGDPTEACKALRSHRLAQGASPFLSGIAE